MPGTLSQLLDDLSANRLRVVDLTAPLGPDTPVIELPPNLAPSPGVTVRTLSRYDDNGPAWYWNALSFGEHSGTHFDAPIHWITGKDLPDNACDTIPPKRFVGPACVIDVTREVEANPDFLLTPEHIQRWEDRYGWIPHGSWVLLRSGWSHRTDPKSFLNIGVNGPHSPGPSAAAVKFLVKRDILGFGVETVGTDAGQAASFDPPFPAHTIIHGAGRFGLASLRNLDQLPPTGAVVIAAPLKIVNGSGSPVRVIAFAPA